MKLSIYTKILSRQLITKWGRFILASGGIMVGIWAIVLTTSLSTGVLGTITTALNSQASAREISIFSREDGQTSFFNPGAGQAPKFVALGQDDIKKISAKDPNIIDIQPDLAIANGGLKTVLDQTGKPDRCYDINKLNTGEPDKNAQPKPIENPEKTNQDLAKCTTLTFSSFVFENLYLSKKDNWLGQTTKPAQSEIVLCFKCNDLGQKLGYKEPKEMLGQSISLDFVFAPNLYKPGTTYDTANLTRQNKINNTNRTAKFKIASVIDDRNDSFLAGSSSYMDIANYYQTMRTNNPNLNDKDFGTLQLTGFLKSYDSLASSKEILANNKLLGFSILEGILTGVTAFFAGLTVVLSGFGLIAMIASIFGIVNVMAISVLERQKEIGVLKALGAKNWDIFMIFLFESILLGFLGWLFGVLLAIASGLGIAKLFNLYSNNNPDWQKNLAGLNIKEFNPSFSWWLLLGCLILAVVVTAISGLAPAIKAARQNPVDVLRSE